MSICQYILELANRPLLQQIKRHLDLLGRHSSASQSFLHATLPLASPLGGFCTSTRGLLSRLMHQETVASDIQSAISFTLILILCLPNSGCIRDASTRRRLTFRREDWGRNRDGQIQAEGDLLETKRYFIKRLSVPTFCRLGSGLRFHSCQCHQIKVDQNLTARNVSCSHIYKRQNKNAYTIQCSVELEVDFMHSVYFGVGKCLSSSANYLRYLADLTF